MCSAQTDTVLPQWKKGDFKKVTYTTISPNFANGVVLENDTSITSMIWEFMEAQDSSLIFSIIPLSIELKTKNDTLKEASEFLINFFTILKERGVAIPYKTHKNGALFFPKENTTIIDLLDERYINQEAFMKEIKRFALSIELQDYIQNNQIQADSLIRFLILSYIDPMIQRIHSPFGHAFKLGQKEILGNITKEECDIFIPNLNYEENHHLFNGQYQYQKHKGKIECLFDFEANQSSLENSKPIESKKKKNSSQDDVFIKFNYQGKLKFNSNNYFPTKYEFKNTNSIKQGKYSIIKTAEENILFE